MPSRHLQYGWPLMVHVEEATEMSEGSELMEMKLMDTPVVTADRVMKSVVFWRETLGETTSWADMSVPIMLKSALMSLRGDGYFPGGKRKLSQKRQRRTWTKTVNNDGDSRIDDGATGRPTPLPSGKK